MAYVKVLLMSMVGLRKMTLVYMGDCAAMICRCVAGCAVNRAVFINGESSIDMNLGVYKTPANVAALDQ